MEKQYERLRDTLFAYAELKALYVRMYALMSTARDEAKASAFDMNAQVNMIYVLREMGRYADDLRKEAEGIQHLLEQLCCLQHTVSLSTDPVRAAFATGSPTVNVGVKLPNKNAEPERYSKLMKGLGINEDLVAKGLFKPDWKKLCEHASALASEGKPLPPGIDPKDTFPTYGVTLRKAVPLDEIVEDLRGKETEAEQIAVLSAKRQ